MSVAELLDEVYAVTESRATEHNVEFIKNVDGSAGILEGDHMALQSLLVNLLENSMDACRVDQKKTDHRVTLSAIGDNKTVQIEVADTGIGMDKETKSHRTKPVPLHHPMNGRRHRLPAAHPPS